MSKNNSEKKIFYLHNLILIFFVMESINWKFDLGEE
jgi:hypothetical protein